MVPTQHFLKLKTVSEVTKTVPISIEVYQYVNKPPAFNGPFVSELSIDVVRAADGALKSGSAVTYTSPKATDPENE
jgi:hypothetical protein